jgi:hypothetical protein
MPLDDRKATNPKAALRRALDVFARRAEYEVDDLRRATDDVSSDVVIVDANCWGAAAVAEASGLPWLPWPRRPGAELRVLAMQRKLHHWAKIAPGRALQRAVTFGQPTPVPREEVAP